MAFGDPVADIGGYGPGFGGPIGPDDDKDISLEEAINQAIAKFGNPVSRAISYGVNQAVANVNPAMGLMNVLGTAKNLIDSGAKKMGLDASPDLSLTNPNKFEDDPGVFSGQTLSPSTWGGNIGGFDIEGGPYNSLGTMVGDTVIGAIEEGFPNVQFGIDPDAVPLGSVSPGMGMGGGPDAANMSLDDFGMSSPPGESVTGLFDPVLDFMNQILDPRTPQDLRDYERTNPFGLDLYDDQGNQVPFQAPDDLSAVFDMSNAIASIEPNAFESAFGTGYQGISPDIIGPDFDQGAVSEAGGEALQEALAQRAAETIIAQEAARRVTPQSNRVTIPTSSGPDIVIDVTPPEPRNPVRSRPVRPENVEQRNPSDSPIRIAAKTIAKPKAFKKLPKFAQKELRQGKVPTTGSDHVQQMVSDFLARTHEPVWQPGSKGRPTDASR